MFSLFRSSAADGSAAQLVPDSASAKKAKSGGGKEDDEDSDEGDVEVIEGPSVNESVCCEEKKKCKDDLQRLTINGIFNNVRQKVMVQLRDVEEWTLDVKSDVHVCNGEEEGPKGHVCVLPKGEIGDEMRRNLKMVKLQRVLHEKSLQDAKEDDRRQEAVKAKVEVAFAKHGLGVLKMVGVTKVGVEQGVEEVKIMEDHLCRFHGRMGEMAAILGKLCLRARTDRELSRMDTTNMSHRVPVSEVQKNQFDMEMKLQTAVESRLKCTSAEMSHLEQLNLQANEALMAILGKTRSSLRSLKSTETRVNEMGASVKKFSAMVDGANPEWVVMQGESSEFVKGFREMRDDLP